METFDAIRGRRSIRKFKPEKISREILQKIMEAALWSPSGSNVQPWEFFVIEEEAEIKKIKALSPGIFDLPAALVIVCRDIRRAHQMTGEEGDVVSLMDISMASQNMMLMAYALGIGSCAVRSFGISAIKRLYDLPEHINPELLITLGHPEKIPHLPKRREIDHVVHWGRR